MQLTYYDAKTDKVYSMNAGWNSYVGETDSKTIPSATDLNPGQGRKTLVPGFMAGIESMHQRFGKLPFADLFAPAIWYSENGITVTPPLAYFFSSRQKFLTRTAEGRVFLRQAVSAIGSALLPETVRLLLGSFGNHLDVQTVLAAPPLLLNFDYAKRDIVQVPEGKYDQEFLTNLGASGFTVQIKSMQEVGSIKGTAAIGLISAPAGARQSVENSSLFNFADAF